MRGGAQRTIHLALAIVVLAPAVVAAYEDPTSTGTNETNETNRMFPRENLDIEGSNETIDSLQNSTTERLDPRQYCELLATEPGNITLEMVVNATGPILENATDRPNTSSPADENTTLRMPVCEPLNLTYNQTTNFTLRVAELYLDWTNETAETVQVRKTGGNPSANATEALVPGGSNQAQDGPSDPVTFTESILNESLSITSGCGIPTMEPSPIHLGIEECPSPPPVPPVPGLPCDPAGDCTGEPPVPIPCLDCGAPPIDPPPFPSDPCDVDCLMGIIEQCPLDESWLECVTQDIVESVWDLVDCGPACIPCWNLSCIPTCVSEGDCLPPIPCLQTNCLGQVPCMDEPCLPSCDEGECADPCADGTCDDPCGETCNDPCGDTCQDPCGDTCQDPCGELCGAPCEQDCGCESDCGCDGDCGGCESDCFIFDVCEDGECQENCALPAGLDPWMGSPSPLAVNGMPEVFCEAVVAPCQTTSHPAVCDGDLGERECDLPATSEASPMPEAVCNAIEAPCETTQDPLVCQGSIGDPCDRASGACEIIDALTETCAETDCEPECSPPAVVEENPLPSAVCDAVVAACDLADDCNPDPCGDETSDDNLCQTIETLTETCEGEECGQQCDVPDAPEEVLINEMPVIVCDTLGIVCNEANGCQPPGACDIAEIPGHCGPVPEPCNEANCDPDPCEETSQTGLCTIAEDPCVPEETRELCVTYTYDGQTETLPLNTPWLVPSATGAPSAVVWFVGAPLLVPENLPDPDLSPAGIAGSLLVLPGDSLGGSEDQVPVSVTYQDATFGTQASSLEPSIVAIDARATMKPASDATGMLGTFSPVQVDGSRLSANVRVISAVEPGPSVHGSVGGLPFSLAYTGSAATWEARIQFEKDTMIRDPVTNTGTQLGTHITFDWNAPTTGDLLVSVTGTELGITRMPATVTGAQFLMSDEPGNRLWAVDWPSESTMDAITATIDGDPLFSAQHPPALFTASVRMRLDEAPQGATQATLESLSTAAGGWEYIEADVRGTPTSDPGERFDLTVSPGDVTVELTDLNANVHVTYAQPTEQPEDAVIPAFILDAGHPENIDQPVSGPVLSRAEITVGQTATVIAQDIVDAHVDTRQGANSADRDAYASHVTFGEQGLIEITHNPSAVKTRLSAASQTMELSLVLTQDGGQLGTAHLDTVTTGEIDLHITQGFSTILQLVNVQTGTINLGACDGHVTMTFGDRGHVTFTGNLDLNLGEQVDGVLDAAGGCSDSGSAGSGSLPLISILEPEALNFEWDLSADTADFAWRLSPFGRLELTHDKFEIDVIPFASEGYDELQYDMKTFEGSIGCDEAGYKDAIHLGREGDAEVRCRGSLQFETIGAGTAVGFVESFQESL